MARSHRDIPNLERCHASDIGCFVSIITINPTKEMSPIKRCGYFLCNHPECIYSPDHDKHTYESIDYLNPLWRIDNHK